MYRVDSTYKFSYKCVRLLVATAHLFCILMQANERPIRLGAPLCLKRSHACPKTRRDAYVNTGTTSLLFSISFQHNIYSKHLNDATKERRDMPIFPQAGDTIPSPWVVSQIYIPHEASSSTSLSCRTEQCPPFYVQLWPQLLHQSH